MKQKLVLYRITLLSLRWQRSLYQLKIYGWENSIHTTGQAFHEGTTLIILTSLIRRVSHATSQAYCEE